MPGWCQDAMLHRRPAESGHSPRCRDYRAMPELDRYDPRDIDDAESGGSFGAAQGARLAADLAMERGDAREGRVTGRRARLPGALEGTASTAMHRLSLRCSNRLQQAPALALSKLAWLWDRWW